ncbi:MAG TPA: amidohydrolase family protein, partial [Blastocatellia bacterium]|nr:amidohydrolase family protein [Blastocatellia bacterium]
FYDAIHYRDEVELYERVRQGVPRPEYDKRLAALGPVLKGELPALFVAKSDLDIRRALMISDEFHLRPIIEDATTGYRVAGMLASRKVPVILSVDYPRISADLPDDVEEPLRTLLDRAEAPKGAARLASAGVKLAFSSGKLKPAEFIVNVRKAIAEGLPEDQALAALTSNAAQILGVSSQLGTLERGKIANVIVTTGDLFAPDSKVTHVFIDGNEADLKKPEEGEKPATVPDHHAEPLAANKRLDELVIEGEQLLEPPQGQPRETLIKNATILTASHGTIENGSILIRDGKIAEVGKEVTAAGPNVRVIDAAGKYVTPGIIDCHSHTAIEGGVNEGTLSVTAMVRIRDVINPYDPDIYRELAGGLTTANVLHGSANAIGGQNAVIKLKLGKPVDEWIIPDAPQGIKFALGENPKRSNFIVPGAPRRYPATRMGVEETIRQAFDRAKDYKREWDEYRAKKATSPTAIAPRRDLLLDAIVEVLEGKRLIHSHCYRDDEILMLLNLGDEIGFHVQTLQHVLEGYKVADEIAAHHAGASTFADFWSYKAEAYDAIPYNGALMASRGVIVSVNSDSDERARRLYLEAAKMMKYGGMTEEQALRTVTLNAAIQLGIDKRTGSIDPGKDADITIFSRHPFSVYTVPEMTIIEGQVYFDLKEDLKRRDATKRVRGELAKIEREANKPPRKSPSKPPKDTPEPAEILDTDGLR